MTEEQRDALITKLSLYNPLQIREIVAEYQHCPKRSDCSYPFYDYLEEKLQIEGYWQKVGLA